MDEFEDFPELLAIADLIQTENDRGNTVRRIVVHAPKLWCKLVALWADLDWQGVSRGYLGCTWLGFQWCFEDSTAEESFSVILDGH